MRALGTKALDASIGAEGPPATDAARVGVTLSLPAGTRIRGLSCTERRRLIDRGGVAAPKVSRTVAELIEDVRLRGDEALRDQAARFDGVTLDAIEVPAERWTAALAEIDPAVRRGLEQAAEAIRVFHAAQLPQPLEVEVRPGLKLGRRAEPLARVGVYAPGGRAAYPSSVLMAAVPARVAGVGEVVVCSPAGSDGLPSPLVLAASAIAGADRVFAIGGAGAIAALAFGTDGVPRVDRIVGPGNAYVAEAKRQLAGFVGIDCPAGPSEILILADDGADAEVVAAELIAQAEHDPDAAAVLATTSAQGIVDVLRALEDAVPLQPRRAIIQSSFAARGALLLAEDLEELLDFGARYAPEHLLVLTRDPRALLPRLRNAGSVFLGAPTSVAFGDYVTGANHVLPTGGAARTYSGLSTLDFVRWFTYQEADEAAAAELAAATALLAEAEGLPGHASAASMRGRS